MISFSKSYSINNHFDDSFVSSVAAVYVTLLFSYFSFFCSVRASECSCAGRCSLSITKELWLELCTFLQFPAAKSVREKILENLILANKQIYWKLWNVYQRKNLNVWHRPAVFDFCLKFNWNSRMWYITQHSITMEIYNFHKYTLNYFKRCKKLDPRIFTC